MIKDKPIPVSIGESTEHELYQEEDLPRLTEVQNHSISMGHLLWIIYVNVKQDET